MTTYERRVMIERLRDLLSEIRRADDDDETGGNFGHLLSHAEGCLPDVIKDMEASMKAAT